MRWCGAGGRGRGHRLAQDRRLPRGLPLLLAVRACSTRRCARPGSTSRRSSRRRSETAATGATEFCIVAAVRGPDERLMDQVREGVAAIQRRPSTSTSPARSACSPRSRSTSSPRSACTATTTTSRPRGRYFPQRRHHALLRGALARPARWCARPAWSCAAAASSAWARRSSSGPSSPRSSPSSSRTRCR